MKIKPIIIIVLLLGVFQSYGQQSQKIKFYDRMSVALEALYAANSEEFYLDIAEEIQKIAEEEQSKWIPYYHSAYAYTMGALKSKDTAVIEKSLDKAQSMIDEANKLHPYHTEITALQGYILEGRIYVDPPNRVQKYLPLAVKEYDKARFLDKENPRPYYLIGQTLYKIPTALGGNKENACKHFSDAKEKFDAFKPRSKFSPNWGKEANNKMLKNCQ